MPMNTSVFDFQTTDLKYITMETKQRRKLEKIYVYEKLVSEEEPLDLQKFWRRKSSSRRDRIPFYGPCFPQTFPSFCLSSPQHEQQQLQILLLNSQQEQLRLRQASWHGISPAARTSSTVFPLNWATTTCISSFLDSMTTESRIFLMF